MKYKYLPHTADQYIEAYGSTLEEAFENVALGMENMMVQGIEPKVKVEFEVQGKDEKELLYNFLDKLLFYKDTENLFFSKFKVKIEKNKLHATCFGESFDPSKHTSDIEVKAVTYHDLVIKKEDNNFIVKVLVDI